MLFILRDVMVRIKRKIKRVIRDETGYCAFSHCLIRPVKRRRFIMKITALSMLL